MQETTITILGMHCQGCVTHVTRTLQRLPGVEPVDVWIGSARLRLDPSRTTLDAVRDALDAAGFEVPAGPP
jgi:copper chaperone CopZ